MPHVDRLTEEAARQATAEAEVTPLMARSLARLAAPYSGPHTEFNARFEQFLFSIHDGVVERVKRLPTNEVTEVRGLLADAANAIRDLLPHVHVALPSHRKAGAVLLRIEKYQGVR